MKYNIFFDNVGIGDLKYLSLIDKLIREYASAKSICTVSNMDLKKRFDNNLANTYVLGEIDTAIDDNDLDIQDYMPVDEQLIKEMAPYAHECIMVMSRNMAYKDYLSRVNFYYDCLRFWNGILDTYGINLYITESVAHELHGMMVYYLCKVKKIPTIILSDAALPGYSLLSGSIESVKPYKTHINDTELSEITRSFLEKYMEHTADITPEYAKPNSKAMVQHIKNKKCHELSIFRRMSYGLLVLFQSVFQTKSSRLIRFLIKQQGKDYLGTYREALSYYKQHAGRMIKGECFFYVPLHMQPEQSTLPMAGIYENQLLYIKMLSYFIPDGYYIYVKEHPGEINANWAYPHFRDVRYYEALTKIKKVRLISVEEDSYKLLENCVAVAIATGTVGFEAIFRDKQVLMFGSRVFQNAPGVIRIHTLDDCKTAVDQVIKNAGTFKSDRESLKSWLLELQNCSFKNIHHPEYSMEDDKQGDGRCVYSMIKQYIDNL